MAYHKTATKEFVKAFQIKRQVTKSEVTGLRTKWDLIEGVGNKDHHDWKKIFVDKNGSGKAIC